MTRDGQPGSGRGEQVEHVSRHVRRTVGIKVLRDVSRWAEGVERERRQRPLLVGALAVLIVMLTVAAAAVAWFYYRGG